MLHSGRRVFPLQQARALLQRRLFERIGYAGRAGIPPPVSPLMPRHWPENVLMTPAQHEKAIRTLRGYLATRQQYCQKWRPGGPGRPARK